MYLSKFTPAVALRKESVDRNPEPFLPKIMVSVALRKESVDRNTMQKITITVDDVSLSARRAWIEIIMPDAPGAGAAGRSPQGERG